jgi:hypothetical protein
MCFELRAGKKGGQKFSEGDGRGGGGVGRGGGVLKEDDSSLPSTLRGPLHLSSDDVRSVYCLKKKANICN